jgi:hypothetical protein
MMPSIIQHTHPYRGFLIDYYTDMDRYNVRYEQQLDQPSSIFGDVIQHVFGWHDTLLDAMHHVDALVDEVDDEITPSTLGFGRN